MMAVRICLNICQRASPAANGNMGRRASPTNAATEHKLHCAIRYRVKPEYQFHCEHNVCAASQAKQVQHAKSLDLNTSRNSLNVGRANTAGERRSSARTSRATQIRINLRVFRMTQDQIATLCAKKTPLVQHKNLEFKYIIM